MHGHEEGGGDCVFTVFFSGDGCQCLTLWPRLWWLIWYTWMHHFIVIYLAMDAVMLSRYSVLHTHYVYVSMYWLAPAPSRRWQHQLHQEQETQRMQQKYIKKNIQNKNVIYIFQALLLCLPIWTKNKKMPPTPASRAHRRAQTPVVTQCCRSCSTQSAHVVWYVYLWCIATHREKFQLNRGMGEMCNPPFRISPLAGNRSQHFVEYIFICSYAWC